MTGMSGESPQGGYKRLLVPGPETRRVWAAIEDHARLVAFVSARLDEEETCAREAADGDSGRWFMGEKWNVYRAEDTAPYADTDEHDLVAYGNVKPQSEYIARMDPARTLRRVRATRAVLDAYVMSVRMLGEGLSRDKLMLVRVHAGIWEDHPDYDPAWKPGQ